MRILNHTFSFDPDYFDFLSEEILNLSKEIHEDFKSTIVKNKYVFSLLDQMLKKIIFDLQPFTVLCHVFYCLRGSKMIGRCQICTPFFIDEEDIGRNIDQNFTLDFHRLKNTLVENLMTQVKMRIGIVALNLYYIVGGVNVWRTENFGEAFVEVANNSFGIYFNELKPITQQLEENYLSKKSDLIKVKNESRRSLFSLYFLAGNKIMKEEII